MKRTFGLLLVAMALSVFAADAAVLYVNGNNATPAAPYASWATAARTIQDAVDAANAGDTVLVTNGVYRTGGGLDDYYGYDITNRVLIQQVITVRSINGPAVTSIEGVQPVGTNSTRCVEIADGAVLSGFTLINGATADETYWGYETGYTGQQSGGGVYAEGPTAVVTNCVITGCSARFYGGAADGCILQNCILTNNGSEYQGGGGYSAVLLNCSLFNNQSSAGGAGAESCMLTNCVLSGNVAQGNGGGAEGGTLVNCVLAGNSVLAGNGSPGNGGGCSGSTAYNCTFTGNSASGQGGGACGSTVANCIMFYNTATSGANFSGSTINYSCTTPLPDGGVSNFAADPQLIDSEHLKATSPCIGTGNPTYVGGVDIDGQAWLNPPSVGCDEFYPGPAPGPLLTAIETTFTNVAAGFPAAFTGIIIGHATNVVWNFSDGTLVSNQPAASHSWSVPGNYKVTLTAFDDSNPGGVATIFPVQVLAQPVFYVNANGASPTTPYNSWATAATNIQDAVNAATLPGSLVLVTNGIYQFGGQVWNGSLTNVVVVSMPMLVMSVNGPGATVILGNPVLGDSATRCVYLANGAMLSGFTVTNGATRIAGDVSYENSGGGIRCETMGSVVSNCVVSGNYAENYGGGIEGGTILNCTVTGNTAGDGGGAHGAELRDCLISLNTAGSGGGGVESCIVRNSALTANTGNGPGGGADNSELFNCTVTGNQAGAAGGGVNNSTADNSIVYFNTSPVGGNAAASTLNFSCTTPTPASGSNNITSDPQLADNAHIRAGSPCIGAGSAGYATGVDVDGEAWANPPSMGCDEFHAGAVTTPLSVVAEANYTNLSTGFAANFSALISGRATTSQWNFGDGTSVTNQIYPVHAWLVPGDYTVTFTAYNDANPGGVSATVGIQVAAENIMYADVNSLNPVAPFTSWATAATNIQDAVDAAPAGGTVMVNDGIYQFGGRVVFGGLTNRVAVVRPINLQSVNGAAATFIVGYPANDDTAVRGVLLMSGCAMSGFTVTNCSTRGGGDFNLEESGGGVWCQSTNVVVTGCAFENNIASGLGGGGVGGTFVNCTFVESSAANGGGAANATLENCTLWGNYAGSTGGGGYNCVFETCTVTQNSASSTGGGADSSVLRDSFIATNNIGWGDGGGVSSSYLTNCDVVANASPISAGGVTSCTLVNCRLLNNNAGSEGGSGGGAAYSTLTGCIVAGNSIYALGGGVGFSTVNNCVITNNYGAYEGGGVYGCYVTNSTLTGNSAQQLGGGASVSVMSDCIMAYNSSGQNGGGYSGISYAYSGVGNSLNGCAVYENTAQNGGGIESAVANNCTIIGNYASQSGGGADQSTLANCIDYYNFALASANYAGGVLSYCCAQPLPAGSGNITNAPLLADFAHISDGSPCRGAGSALAASGTDIDGEPWLNPPSIGCNEIEGGAVTGPLAVAVAANFTSCATGFAVTFVGQVAGHATNSVWSFGDGTTVSNQLYLTHAWSGGGDFTATLTAFNSANPSGVSGSVVVHVLANAVYYVSPASTSPVAPFNSWATAATNIQDAVDAAVAGGTVLATNGDYNTGERVVLNEAATNRLVIDKPVVVTSVNGAAFTAIEGFNTNDNISEIRCVYLTNYATLSGFTLTNGATGQTGDYYRDCSGAGAWCEPEGVVSNCVFINGNAPLTGGGVYGGTLLNCVFTNNFGYSGGAAYNSILVGCNLAANLGYYGGGACNASLTNCTLTGNYTYIDGDYTANGGGASGCTLTGCVISGNASLTGAGASSCTLFNCLLTGNSTLIGDGVWPPDGGGAYGSTLVNCTVTGNSANNTGGGVTTCTLTNCIVYFNTAPNGSNCSDDSSLFYCDTTPLPTNGMNNISSDPLFADIEHISAASPCRGAGIFSATSGTDIDGDAWLNPPSIGCDEFNASSATGALVVAISETFTNVATGLTVDFTAAISGHATANLWNFGDGTTVTNELAVSHSWNTPGNYPVTLTVYNTDNPGGVSTTVTIFVLQNPVQYVAQGNATPAAPYLTWGTAATNIQDAVDAGFAGGMILVSNGLYQTGSRVSGTDNNRVIITKPLVLQSVNGAAATVVDGGGAMRCFYLTNQVTLTGFTLQNGLANNGGGVLCQGDDVLNECVLAGNSTTNGGSGGGSYGGTLNGCTFTGNYGDYAGGGAESGTLSQCVLAGNAAITYGGGADGSLLNNCVLTNNYMGTIQTPAVRQAKPGPVTPFIVSTFGGGAANSTLNECVLTGNSAQDGGGTYGGTANNCLFFNNSANFAGGAESGTLNNCTVVANMGWNEGGGMEDGTMNNCIAYYNTNGDAFYGTLNYCCTTGNPGGFGNITNAPLFVNLAGGDFHLQTNSPCINSGNNSYVTGSIDLDGNARIAGGMVDIGAYEFQTPTSVISYAYLQEYGLPTDGSVDYADLDHSGMNTWQHWQTGTSPVDPTSVLRMMPLGATNLVPGTGVTVTWESVYGISYSVWRGSSLTAPFSVLQSDIVAQTNITSFTDVSATNSGAYFYRVSVP